VFEQVSELLPVGASLQLGPNATRLLHELDLLEPLRAVASRPQAVDLLRWDDGALLLHAEHGDAAERGDDLDERGQRGAAHQRSGDDAG